MAGTMVDIKAISCQIHEGSISFVDPVMFCFWIANFAIVAFQFLFSYKFPEKKTFLNICIPLLILTLSRFSSMLSLPGPFALLGILMMMMVMMMMMMVMMII